MMQARSRLFEAEDYFVEALDLSTKIGDVVSEAESLAGLTVILRSHFSEARNAIQKAISIREGDYLHILARVFVTQTDFEQAKKTFALSQTIHEDSGDLLGRWDDFYYLALVAFYQGKTWLAKNIAKNELLPPSTFLQKADILVLNIHIWIHRGDLESAQYLLLEAEDIYS